MSLLVCATPGQHQLLNRAHDQEQAYRKRLDLVLGELARSSEIGAEGFVTGKVLFERHEEVAEALFLGGQRGVGFDPDEEPTLEVDQGVEVHEQRPDLVRRQGLALRQSALVVLSDQTTQLSVGNAGLRLRLD